VGGGAVVGAFAARGGLVLGVGVGVLMGVRG